MKSETMKSSASPRGCTCLWLFLFGAMGIALPAILIVVSQVAVLGAPNVLMWCYVVGLFAYGCLQEGRRLRKEMSATRRQFVLDLVVGALTISIAVVAALVALFPDR